MQYFSYAAGILQLCAHIPLIISILKNKAKPSTTSMGIWTLLSFSLLFSSMASGAYSNIPFIVAGCIATTTIFVLSLKYGYRNWTILDPVCLVLGIFGIVVWIYTKNASYNVYIATVVDWIALVPIIYKSWHDPWSESLLNWRINLLAGIFLVLAVQDTLAVVIVVAYTQLLHSILINTILMLRGNSARTTKS